VSHAAIALMKKGDISGAVREFRASLNGEPGRSGVRYNLAVALERTPGGTDDAIRQYEKIVENNSGYVQQAHVNLASACLWDGRTDEAVSHYRRALEMQMDSPRACYNLGWTLTVSGAPHEGLAFLRRAISLSPAFLLATRDLTWFLATHPSAEVRDPNEAIRLGEQA
jgi:Flp pilus assembly protein TadD